MARPVENATVELARFQHIFRIEGSDAAAPPLPSVVPTQFCHEARKHLIQA